MEGVAWLTLLWYTSSYQILKEGTIMNCPRCKRRDAVKNGKARGTNATSVTPVAFSLPARRPAGDPLGNGPWRFLILPGDYYQRHRTDVLRVTEHYLQMDPKIRV